MASAQSILTGLGPGLEAYIAGVRAHCSLATVDTDYLDPPVIHMNSGLAKIHSLASLDGLVVFDSRVAKALGTLISEYCHIKKIYPIPAALRLFRTSARTPIAVSDPAGIGASDNHRLFPQQPFAATTPRNLAWLDAQIRVSWLIEAVLIGFPGIFPGLSHRHHRLEAARFMMGA
jgi:hypothetical protein